MDNYTSKEESQRFRNTLNFLVQQKQITQSEADSLQSKDNEHEDANVSQRTRSSPKYYAWIGINPSGETMTSLASALPKLPYANYEAVIEQNTKHGIRPHIHALALVNENTRPNKEISRLGDIFDIKTNFIEFKISNNNRTNISRRRYMRGEKTSEKKENTEKDIKDRLLLGIPNLISKGIL